MTQKSNGCNDSQFGGLIPEDDVFSAIGEAHCVKYNGKDISTLCADHELTRLARIANNTHLLGPENETHNIPRHSAEKLNDIITLRFASKNFLCLIISTKFNKGQITAVH